MPPLFPLTLALYAVSCTLYFLATFPRVKQSAFAMVPLSRRARFTLLAEEIMRRTGAYAIGQAAACHDTKNL